jgi:large subunit ribosomal protein L6
MSRLAKKGISVPAKVEAIVADERVSIKGPKGELHLATKPSIKIALADGLISIEPKNDERLTRALVGTYASRLNAMIAGVQEPFKRVLLLEGVGYKAEVKGKTLAMALGLSHPVNVEIPEGLTVTSEKGTITVTGIDKVEVGQFAAYVRSLKKPEPYKGKGFRYEGEVIRRKQGKKSV